MRIDRLLTLGLFGPLRQLVPGSHAARLPILMYHSVSESPEDGTSEYFRLSTSPSRFEEQMYRLSELGCQGVTLRDGLEALDGKRKLARRPVVISFDDGFRDFYTNAFPILGRLGFSATMYLPTAYIADKRLTFRLRECLTWQEIRELQRYGFEFGSHTVNHPSLYALPWPEIEKELALSRKRIEQELSAEARSFAYPYAFPQADGAFAKNFSALLKNLGYLTCVTTIIGSAQLDDDMFQLKRLPVNDSDDLSLFTAKLEGSYDWLAMPQASLKKARYLFGSERRSQSLRERFSSPNKTRA